MIAHLRGKLLAKHPNQAIVETGGVGYDVTISVPTFSDLPAIGGEVTLHIHTHVREDLIALYGFLLPAEKLLFEKLITVSSRACPLDRPSRPPRGAGQRLPHRQPQGPRGPAARGPPDAPRRRPAQRSDDALWREVRGRRSGRELR